MRYHSKFTHSVIQLKCHFCDEKFTSGIERKTHCLKIHGKQDEPIGDNKLKCMMCEKVVKKSLITVHRQTHMSIKKIECPLCHLKIKYKKSLLKHAKIFHTSEEEQHFIQKFKEQDLVYILTGYFRKTHTLSQMF